MVDLPRISVAVSIVLNFGKEVEYLVTRAVKNFTRIILGLDQ